MSGLFEPLYPSAPYRATPGAALFKVCRTCGIQTDEWDPTPGPYWPEQDQCFPCREAAWSEALRAMARRVAIARDTVAAEVAEQLDAQGKALSAMWRQRDQDRHDRHHRRWMRGPFVQWLEGWAYQLGVISSGGTEWGGACNGCITVRFRGRRPYVLGLLREEWFCLLRGRHRRREIPGAGLCSVCAPCPTCLSADPTHDAWTCELAAERERVAETRST